MKKNALCSIVIATVGTVRHDRVKIEGGAAQALGKIEGYVARETD